MTARKLKKPMAILSTSEDGPGGPVMAVSGRGAVKLPANVKETIRPDGQVIYDFTGSDATQSPNQITKRLARTRTLLMALRQALIIALGALEEYLGMDRSIVPRRKRGISTDKAAP